MRNKIIDFSLPFFLLILILIVGYGTFHCSSFNYNKTTGFYFQGLNSTQIGFVSSIGFDKKGEKNKEIYCFEQYRQNDKYIYKDWRKDLKYFNLINKITVYIPDTLVNKIEYVWFKSGRNIIKYTGSDFFKNWNLIINDSIFELSSPDNIIPESKLLDGLICFLKTDDFSIIRLRKKCYFLVLLIIIIGIYRCRNELLEALSTIFNKNRTYISKKKKIFTHLLSFFLGVILVFITFEISLRIIGYFHNKNNIEKQLNTNIKSTNSIICIGDSFTESFGSTSNNDYPSQLERIINKEQNIEFSVVNLGRSGKNTAQINIETPLYIEKFKPKIAILLAGSANYWNYWGYKKESFWNSLKTIKFIKLIVDNIRFENSKNIFDIDEYVRRRIHYKSSLEISNNKITPFISKLRAAHVLNNYSTIDSSYSKTQLSENNIRHLILFSLITKNKFQLLNNLNIDKQKNTQIRFLTTVYQNIMLGKSISYENFPPYYVALSLYLSQSKSEIYSKDILQKCILLNPYVEDFYFQLATINKSKIKTPNAYYQKRYCIQDSIYYYQTLFGINKNQPDTNIALISESLDLEIKTKKIGHWVANDIEKIIETCNQNGVKLILMNYPILHKTTLFYSVNQILSDIATKHNLPFVDNTQIFDTIATNRLSYFISDGHCSDKGYKLMARNIFKTMLDNNMLTENE